MKMITIKHLLICAAMSGVVISCTKKGAEAIVPSTTSSIIPTTEANANYVASDFTTGVLFANIVNPNACKPLGGALIGDRTFVSNLPEFLLDTGWVFRSDATNNPVFASGKLMLYLYHYNGAGKNLQMHIIFRASGGAATVRGYGITSVKSATNSNPSNAVATWWANNRVRIEGSTTPDFTLSLPSANAVGSIRSIDVPQSQSVDARYEIEVTGNTHCYVVFTAPGTSVATAYAMATRSRARGNYYFPPTDANYPNQPIAQATCRLGREGGVYQYSAWFGDTYLNLPTGTGYLGLAFNTETWLNNCRATPSLVTVQDQTAGVVGYMSIPTSNAGTGSLAGVTPSLRTYANYGHKYNMQLFLRNTQNRSRTVELVLATNNNNGFSTSYYNGPIDVAGTIRNYNVTGASPATSLGIFSVPAGTTSVPGVKGVPIKLYVPGLASANSQIIVKVLD